MFRFFNFFLELKTINEELKNIIWQTDRLPHILNLFSRLGFALYFFFDNVDILASIKVLTLDKKPWVQRGNFCWYIALLFALMKDLYELNKCYSKKTTTPEEKLDNQRQILKIFLGVVAKLGDLPSAAAGSGLTSKYLGGGYSELTMSIGGLTSACIGLYQMWSK